MTRAYKQCTLLLFFLCFGMFSSQAIAREAITSFRSDVTILQDASLVVRETITVIAEGNQIKRGIVREFPTSYKDRYGHRFRVNFEVQSVRRGGQAEPWHTEKRSNGVALYVGSADVVLERGEHQFEIIYRTTRQIGYHDDFDELYWNVTGNGWRLPIEKVVYTLNLPGQSRAIQIAAYTGASGEAGKDYRLTDDTQGLVRVATTRSFAEGEGLTVAVSFPQGLIHRPDAGEKTNLFLRDNAGILAGLIGLVVILGYYLFFWDRSGRDPEGGAIIPRFKPPEGFSPAAARFVYKMSYDRKAFSSAVINMAVKGYLEIDEEGDEFTLRQIGTSSDMLTRGEHRIASRLFSASDQITLVNENHTIVARAISAFETGLKSEYQHTYFITNLKFFIGGLVLTTLSIFAVAIMNANLSPPPITIAVMGITCALAAATAVFTLNFQNRKTVPQVNFASLLSSRSFKYAVIALVFFPQVAIGTVLTGELGTAVPLLGLAFGLVNGVFLVLLKAPTQMGRSILDEIEGFRLYLGVAEQDRLNQLNPPEKTAELFEKFLPFALALDLENAWSEKFTDVLAAAGAAGEEYHPRWYRGRRWHSGSVGSFSSDLNSTFSNAIASSAVAPGSSSGSGGGGFSGGGGGGGGGGGW
jgi:uncharacterized membrane protein YgcG